MSEQVTTLEQDRAFAALVLLLRAGARLPEGTIRQRILETGRSPIDALVALCGARTPVPATCEKCGRRLRVASSRRVSANLVRQWLECGRCGYKAPAARLVPREAVATRRSKSEHSGPKQPGLPARPPVD